MHNLDTKQELLNFRNEFDLDSELGKTKGPLAPHEFWYYWRKIFGTDNMGYIKDISHKNILEFHKGLDSIKHVFGKPLVLKGMIANNSISKLLTSRPNDLVIFIRRKEEFNAQSLYQSRLDFYGDAYKWYSFGIYDVPISKEPLCQVVEQVIETNSIIEHELSKIKSDQVIYINYETLDTQIKPLFKLISERHSINTHSMEDLKVVNKNRISLPEPHWDILKNHFDKKKL
jgi:hypothetical protein